jgi:Xaa-Pro aminopeptidase
MRNLLRTLGFTTASIAALTVPLAAQIPAADYVARRQALLARIDSGVVVAFGGVEPVAHWPPFSQLPSFQYLTGFAEPNAAVVMTKRAGSSSVQLYLPPRNLRAERFGGPRVGVEDAQARTGMEGRPLANLRAAVDSLAASGLPVYVVRDVHTSDYAQADSLSRGSSFAAALRTKPVVLDGAVDQLRARKTPAEVAHLRRAAEISAAAHLQAMRVTARRR